MKRLQSRSMALLTGHLLLAFLFFYGARSTEAEKMTQGGPEGLTPDSVAAFVDAYVAENMAAAHAPGLVVAVVYQGEQILAKGYGVADLETGRPMTAQTNVRAGSVSKAVTSAAVLQMAAGGQIALDAPMSAVLHYLPLQDRYGAAGTVAQFLALQGGYADTVVQTHAPELESWQPLEQYLQDHLPPRALPPGKVHSYNSWEHALLGQMMAEVTGRPFDEAIAAVLLRPLRLAQTTFRQPLPASIAANLARGYAYTNGAYEEVPLDYVNLSPGIAMVTTGEDMARFMLALLNGSTTDHEEALAPSTVAGMLQRQEAVHALSRGRTYGFSEITLAGRAALYQDGNGIGHGSRMVLVPEQALGIFLSTNHRPLAGDASSTPAFQFVRELSAALLEQYVPAGTDSHALLPPLPDAAARAGRYAGHYRLAGTPQHDFFKLGALLDNVDVRDNGEGMILIGSGRYSEVEPLLFQSESDPGYFVLFVEDDGGAVQWLTFGGTGSYQKVRWYETPRFHLALVGAILLVFLATVVALPFSSQATGTVWLMALLNVVFLAGVAVMMVGADLILFFKTIPPATKLLFLLPWLSGALALTLPAALLALWRNEAPLWLRLLYALDLAGAVGFVWLVRYWNVVWRW